MFVYQDKHFCNVRNKKCLDVNHNKDTEGREIWAWNRHNGKNQRWTVTYAKDAKKIQDEGLNKDFGMKCSEPFYLRSRLPMGRVAEARGASNMDLRRWRKNTPAQQFFFDCKSKTIRSQQWKNYAIEI
jgi:hypothetical protein